MSLSNTFILRPVLTTVCSLLIVIAGLIALPLLPIENLPDIAPPTVQVTSRYVGADAVSVEQGVTSVLEQQINGVENMDFLSSSSAADGTSSIRVTFASGSDGDINQVNVQNRVALAQPSLPEEVRQSGITVNQASNSILLVYNFTSEDPKRQYSLETISGLLDQSLTDAIRRANQPATRIMSTSSGPAVRPRFRSIRSASAYSSVVGATVATTRSDDGSTVGQDSGTYSPPSGASPSMRASRNETGAAWPRVLRKRMETRPAHRDSARVTRRSGSVPRYCERRPRPSPQPRDAPGPCPCRGQTATDRTRKCCSQEPLPRPRQL